MKLIDKMLKIVKDMVTDRLYSFGVDSLFIEALGLDSDRYIVTYPNGDLGYDDMAALKDSVPLIWGEG